MRRAFILSAVLAATVALAQQATPASEAPRLKGDTLEELGRSVPELEASLQPEKARQLEGALMAITEKYRREFEGRLVAELSGKTADELIALGQQITEQNPNLIPQLQRASEEARQSAARSTQQSARAQIELYKLQHQDAAPDFQKHQWLQMTSRTTEAGEDSESNDRAKVFRPYFREAPVNPLRMSSRVLVVKERSDQLQPISDKEVAYIYTADGRLYALDASGKAME